MRSMGAGVTRKDWAAAPGLVLGTLRAILEEDYDELLTRRIRAPLDWLRTWGIVLLAIGMAVGYQLLSRMDALLSVTRWQWHRPRPA
jgi:uncharacterized protein YjeT (DUF2065 family)